MLTRYAGNPIITPRISNKWYPLKAYNPTVVKVGETYRMLFRAVGPDWVSRIMLADSDDGYHFKVHPKPVLEPRAGWDAVGVEDPRITQLKDHYYMTYTAFDGTTARLSLAISYDLKHWTERHILFPDLDHPQRENLPPDWSKAGGIITEPIDGWYYMLFGDTHIWCAKSRDLYFWDLNHDQPIITARPGHFDAAYVEMGPAPIKTDRGWLVIYHGINEFSEHRQYAIGAALLDPQDPHKVIWRSDKPIMVPEKSYETVGFIDLVPGGYKTLRSMSLGDIERLHNHNDLPTAIFCCGAILEGENLRLYYGAADTCICTATVDLASVFAS